MLSSILLAATLSAANLNTLERRLPAGIYGPRAGARCSDSQTALATSNVSGSGRATSAINIWVIHEDNGIAGYLVRSVDKRLWYEDPIGLSYQPVTDASAGLFLNKKLSYSGCFTKDLSM